MYAAKNAATTWVGDAPRLRVEAGVEGEAVVGGVVEGGVVEGGVVEGGVVGTAAT